MRDTRRFLSQDIKMLNRISSKHFRKGARFHQNKSNKTQHHWPSKKQNIKQQRQALPRGAEYPNARAKSSRFIKGIVSVEDRPGIEHRHGEFGSMHEEDRDARWLCSHVC